MIPLRNSFCLFLVFTFAAANLGAQDAERQLYEQWRAAQQERQQQKNDRNQEIRDASSNTESKSAIWIQSSACSRSI